MYTWLSLLALLAAPSADLHVAPTGSERAPGTAARPLATLAGALRVARAAAHRPTRIVVHGGWYELAEPLTFTPADSGLEVVAAPGEAPILSGGRRLAPWRVEGGRWVTEAGPGANFTQLFVNGHRAVRARTPNAGFALTGGPDRARPKTAFRVRLDDPLPQAVVPGATVVVYHSWETSVLPLAAVEREQRTLVLGGPTHWPLGNWGPRQRYYLEGLPEALDAPGEWYLDQASGRVTYLPLPGERPETSTAVAPRLTELVRLVGEPRLGLPVEGVTLRGLTLAHAAWQLEPTGHSDPQAACTLGAAITVTGARGCRFESCRVVHTGRYGVWLRRGSRDCWVRHCEFTDIGGGAVRIGETSRAPSEADRCGGHRVDNCWVHGYGEVYAGAVGLFIAQSGDNALVHNDVSDGPYTAISVGWDWGRAPTDAHRNRIERNHLHHVVNGLLSDAGGIYLLGESDGTVVRYNQIHDIFCHRDPDYSWGLYLDAETHGVLAEGNYVYRCQDGLMLHNGAYRNIIRNNIFAEAVNHLIWRAPATIPEPNRFERNLCIVTQGELFYPDGQPETKSPWDYNLYQRLDGRELTFMEDSFAEWQARGLDQHSVLSHARPADLERETRTLGFAPVPLDGCGLYGEPEWTTRPARLTRPALRMPAAVDASGPRLIHDDFEATPVGDPPAGASVNLGKVAGGRIEVTDRRAASGRHSLEFVDAAGLEHDWDPHCCWQPRLRTGTVKLRLKLYLEAGSQPWVEWRSGGYPYAVGPSLKVDAAGRLSANGRDLATLPREQWLGLEVTCGLGAAANGTWDLTLTTAEAPRVWRGLAGDAGFKRLGWLGIVSLATGPSRFWVDDLALE